MKSKAPLQIVIIDDLIQRGDYKLVNVLDIAYGEANVHLFPNVKEGKQFIKQNLHLKTIVLLDIMFNGKKQGLSVFDEIIEKSNLVCFIIMTGNMEKLEKRELIKLINGHAWSIVQRDESLTNIQEVIHKAALHLTTRVDSALEEWILWHSPQDQAKPYLKTRSGQTYSLLDILHSLRNGGDLGTEMAEGILKLTIDLLARNKEQITDKTK
jgi:hypothetical protein